MELALTDVLTCPRCGPSYGLILLPSEVRQRGVVTGVLGCANCRERWGVEGGVADLRVDPGETSCTRGDGGVGAPDREAAVRLAALLGLTGGGGTVLVAGPAVAHAGLLRSLVPDVAVIVLAGGGAVDGAAQEGVSVLRVGASVPLRSGSMRGVALTGARAEQVEEGARLLGPAGRLLVEPAPADARERLEAAGLRVLAAEADVVVAGRLR